jgi:hypothetical protein
MKACMWNDWMGNPQATLVTMDAFITVESHMRNPL